MDQQRHSKKEKEKRNEEKKDRMRIRKKKEKGEREWLGELQRRETVKMDCKSAATEGHLCKLVFPIVWVGLDMSHHG